MTRRDFISRFSPNRTDPEVLEKITVQRQDLVDQSIGVLRESALTENKHHLLFIGPRGSGKTHLIALLDHRLQGESDLVDQLRIAWLNEDETSTSFLDLLFRIYRALSDRYPSEFPSDDLNSLYTRAPEEARDALSRILINRAGKRTVLVLIENLDALFSQLEEPEQRAWRAFIQNHPIFATAATAQSLFAGVSERDQPFFGFFDARHLKALTVEEATELLQRIAALYRDTKLSEFLSSPRGRARVHAVHHLASGNPRLYIVLSDFITRESLDELVGPFEEMVDEQLTPYYQERLRWLSPLQRKIVEFLCFRSYPVPVKAIAEGLFATHSTITSQLQKLRQWGYVASHPRGRESLYELAEPLMRLSMQVKDTHDHQPLDLIVDFLRVWYERGEIEQRLARIDPAAPEHEYFTAALKKMQSGEPNIRYQLLRQGLEDLDLRRCDDAQLETLRLIAEESSAPEDWMNYTDACHLRNDFVKCIAGLTKIIEGPSALSEHLAKALFNRGVTFVRLGRTADGIADYTRIIEMPTAPAAQVAPALFNRGCAFGQLHRTEEQIADYTRLIEMPGAPVAEKIKAHYNRALTFGTLGRNEEALGDYTRIIEMPTASAENVAGALGDRGVILWRLGRGSEGIADQTRVILMAGVGVEQVARALFNRGTILDREGRTEEAIADYTHVITMLGAAAELVTMTLINRALAFARLGRTEEAIADNTRVVATPGATAEHVARALVNRGLTFGRSGRRDDAIADFTHVLAVEGVPLHQVARALCNRAVALATAGRVEEAIADSTRVMKLQGAAEQEIGSASKNLVAIGEKLIAALFRDIGSPEKWQVRIAEVVRLYAHHECLTYLGDASVRHLAKLAESPLNSQGLDQWLVAWESATARVPALQLPVRLLRAGIAYLKTEPRDETALLKLPKEERRLVRAALKLPPEEAEGKAEG